MTASTALHEALGQLEPGRGAAVLVADSGGHLQEMWEQAKLLGADVERCWITSDTQMSRSLLANEAHTRYLPTRIFPRRADLALRAIPRSFLELRKLRPQAVLSTGPAIAVPWLIAARILRIPALFIESATFVKKRSMSGKILDRIPGVRRYSQTGLITRGWASAPNVFDLVEAKPDPADTPVVQRVFVSVGSNRFPFDRLVRRLETVIPLEWDVVWQLSGEGGYEPKRGRVAGMLPIEEVHGLIRSSSVVVCHAGVGSALTAVELGRVPIVCARSAEHGEHIDNHQQDLTGYLANLPIVVVCEADAITLDDLKRAASPVSC